MSPGLPKRSCHASVIHACGLPASSETWSSSTRVRCHASQATVLACSAGRNTSCSGVKPSSARRKSSSTLLSPSTIRSLQSIATATYQSALHVRKLLDQQPVAHFHHVNSAHVARAPVIAPAHKGAVAAHNHLLGREVGSW